MSASATSSACPFESAESVVAAGGAIVDCARTISAFVQGGPSASAVLGGEACPSLTGFCSATMNFMSGGGASAAATAVLDLYWSSHSSSSAG